MLSAGLADAQREGVLDSFIGWANFAEQQDRQELLQLCAHGLALHYAAAQSRWVDWLRQFHGLQATATVSVQHAY